MASLRTSPLRRDLNDRNVIRGQFLGRVSIARDITKASELIEH